MDSLLKNFQDTESPIVWFIDELNKMGFLGTYCTEDEYYYKEAILKEIIKVAKQKEVELMQKTINRTLLVYKELKRD